MTVTLINQQNLTEWGANIKDLRCPEGKWLCNNNGDDSLACPFNTRSINTCFVPDPVLGAGDTRMS
jgi:hypothetical protein